MHDKVLTHFVMCLNIMWFCIMFFIQMSINVYFCCDFVFVSIKIINKFFFFFFMKSGVLFSLLFIRVGLCLSGVLPDGVWSEWGYAQWGFVRLPSFTVTRKLNI